MARTITALDPLTGTRGLLVEVHSNLDVPSHDIVCSFKQRMFLRNIRVGLLITPTRTVVLRDALSSMEFRENRYEAHELSTGDLFAGAKIEAPVTHTDDAFTRQVVQMLEAIASSWYAFLHPSAVPVMVPDVVGNLAQANLEVWDGLLERHDAAE